MVLLDRILDALNNNYFIRVKDRGEAEELLTVLSFGGYRSYFGFGLLTHSVLIPKCRYFLKARGSSGKNIVSGAVDVATNNGRAYVYDHKGTYYAESIIEWRALKMGSWLIY